MERAWPATTRPLPETRIKMFLKARISCKVRNLEFRSNRKLGVGKSRSRVYVESGGLYKNDGSKCVTK